jgi:GNAT superfamily N-acetyltransferase
MSEVAYTYFPPRSSKQRLARAAVELIHTELWKIDINNLPSSYLAKFLRNRHLVVAHTDEMAVLSSGAFRFEPHSAILSFLATDSGHRGQGLGMTVVQQIEERAAEQGAEYLQLLSLDTAKDFYIHRGYIPVRGEYNMLKPLGVTATTAAVL